MTRPDTLDSRTHRKKTGCGNLYITVGRNDKGEAIEALGRMGKGGGCASSQCEAIGRLVSCALQGGVPLPNIIKALKGIICHQKIEDCQSCADGFAVILTKYEEIKE